MLPSSNKIMSSTIILPSARHAVTSSSPAAATATESSAIATAAVYSTTTNTSTAGVPSSPTNTLTAITYASAAAPTPLNDYAVITQPMMSPGTSVDTSATSHTSVLPAVQCIHPTTTETIAMGYCMDIWLQQTREEGGVRWFRG
ncbi:hypothetical protein BZA77DRAFT_345871 [Pyronema omphalodes]|nr:hypothetical protein BZA77DRAFT_345871 [Pyronema omphalodes]